MKSNRKYIIELPSGYVTDRDFSIFETSPMLENAYLYNCQSTALRDRRKLIKERYLYKAKVRSVEIHFGQDEELYFRLVNNKNKKIICKC